MNHPAPEYQHHRSGISQQVASLIHQKEQGFQQGI
jgi:hypothetical protein